MFVPDEATVSSLAVTTAGLEDTTWLLLKADSCVTGRDTSGLNSDLLVRAPMTSFMDVEALLVTEGWSCEVEACRVVRWVFTPCDDCWLVTVMAGLLIEWMVLDRPTGLCVEE